MKHYEQICLDVDGVICDWYTGAVDALLKGGHKIPGYGKLGAGDPYFLAKQITAYPNWPPGTSFQKYMGITPDRYDNPNEYLWDHIHKDPMFTSRLPIYPWYKELYDLCKRYAHKVVFCSHAASDTAVEFGGKRGWFAWHKIKTPELVIIREKWQLSAPGRLLIDDYHVNVTHFTTKVNEFTGLPYGGRAILSPHSSNENHSFAARSDNQYDIFLSYIESQLRALSFVTYPTLPTAIAG